MKNQRQMEEDQILIPTGKGFISIPGKGIRQPDKQVPDSSLVSHKLMPMKVINYLQFVVMIIGMSAIMAYIGYTISGLLGVVFAFIVILAGFLITSSFSVKQVLKRRNLLYISPSEGRVLYDMVGKLSHKAGLEKKPMLYFDNSPEINAFTVEDKQEAAIVVSRGLINNLSKREIFGVLAHEIAHLKNNDVKIMLFSDQVRRLTSSLSLFGQLLLILSLPLYLLGQVVFPWITILILMAAPTISLLFQVAMSRNREFRADLDAVILAGEAQGLASALQKISRQTSFWRKVYAPYFRNVPEILRTHPNTNSRIERLNQLGSKKPNHYAWLG